MKKRILFLGCFLLALCATVLAAKAVAGVLGEVFLKEPAAVQTHEARPSEVPSEKPEETTLPGEEPTETQPTTQPETAPEQVYFFTAEEEKLLQKLAMAERGDTFCPKCIALVMRTVLNRVESEKFPTTIKGVIYAEDQFGPVTDGTLEKARPHALCAEALEKIETGWDESQGALYYEWSEGESWHSKNLELLFSHCDTRFYK